MLLQPTANIRSFETMPTLYYQLSGRDWRKIIEKQSQMIEIIKQFVVMNWSKE